jgi:hypothetical protein
MADLNTPEINFVSGGSVQAGNGYYVSREADEDLLELCKESTFAYVLAPRQIGKSSLMNNVSERLFKENNIQSVIIDLSPLGKKSTEEMVWYGAFFYEMAAQLGINFDYEEFKQKYGGLGSTKMLQIFLQDIVLKSVSEQIVIFLDEIDSTINLEFKDDFFAAIRHLYQIRAQRPEFHRLSFVLFGVATPGDLISDPVRTPFNLGERVILNDFTHTEVQPMAAGFGLPIDHAGEVLEWIMKWTSGHPYLTLSLCKEISESPALSWTERAIDDLVKLNFSGELGAKERNLKFVQDMLIREVPEEIEPGELLTTYRKIRGGEEVKDDDISPQKAHLKLSGIVRQENGLLKVRNLIYFTYFDSQWIKENLPKTWVAREYRRFRAYAVVLSVLVVIFTALAAYAAIQGKIAEEQRKDADVQRLDAENQRQIAEDQRKYAEEQRQIAEDQKTIAEERGATLEEQKKISDFNAARAKEEEAKAKEKEKEANDLRALADDRARQLEAAIKTVEQQRNEAVELKNEADRALQESQRQRGILDKKAETEKFYREAVALSSRNDRDSAIATFSSALKGYQEMSDWNGVGDTYTHIAREYQQLKKFKDAKDNYESALQSYERLGSPDNVLHAKIWAIINYGSLKYEQNKASGYNYYKENIDKVYNGKPGEADLRFALADFYQQSIETDLGPNDKEAERNALEQFKLALDRYTGKERSRKIDTLQAIIKIYESYIRLVKAKEQEPYPNDSEIRIALAARYVELLDLYTNNGNVSAAAKLSTSIADVLDDFDGQREMTTKKLETIMESCSAVNDSTCWAQTSESLADIYKKKGDKNKAIEVLKRVANEYERLDDIDSIKKILSKVAGLFNESKDLDSALKYFNERRESYDKKVKDENKTEFAQLGSLMQETMSNIYVAQGKVPEAIKTLTEIQSANQMSKAQIYCTIARTYLGISSDDDGPGNEEKREALLWYNKALNIYESLKDSPGAKGNIRKVRLIKGEISYVLGDRQTAFDEYKKAFLAGLDGYERRLSTENLNIVIALIQIDGSEKVDKVFNEAMDELKTDEKKSRLLREFILAYLRAGKQEEALKYCRKLSPLIPFETTEPKGGFNYDKLIPSLYFSYNGDSRSAAEVAEEIYGFWSAKRFKGLDNSDLNNLAGVLDGVGDRSKASELYQRYYISVDGDASNAFVFDHVGVDGNK